MSRDVSGVGVEEGELPLPPLNIAGFELKIIKEFGTRSVDGFILLTADKISLIDQTPFIKFCEDCWAEFGVKSSLPSRQHNGRQFYSKKHGEWRL